MATGNRYGRLIGLDFNDLLALLDLVADFHEHFEDVARFDAIAQFGQFDFDFHGANTAAFRPMRCRELFPPQGRCGRKPQMSLRSRWFSMPLFLTDQRS